MRNFTDLEIDLIFEGLVPGPGCSSVGIGALVELGPFFPNYNGTGLVRNKHSWNKCTCFSDPVILEFTSAVSCRDRIADSSTSSFC